MKVRELKEKANALFARGKYAKSRVLYETALRLEPADPTLLLRVAECSKREGDVPGAASAFSEAASVFKAAGHIARAQAALKLALELKPRDGELLRTLAEIESMRGFLMPSTPAEKKLGDVLFDNAEQRARTPEKFGNSARALSLEEIPIVVDDAAMVDVDGVSILPSAPPVEESPRTSVVRLNEHEVAVRTGPDEWTVIRSASALRTEVLSDDAFWEKQSFAIDEEV